MRDRASELPGEMYKVETEINKSFVNIKRKAANTREDKKELNEPGSN